MIQIKRFVDWLKEENAGDEVDVGVHNWVGIVLCIIWFVLVPYLVVSIAAGR